MPIDDKKGADRGIALPSGTGLPEERGKSWFFGIGINKYKNKEIPDLNNAVGDVEAVLSLLEEKYELDEAVTLFDEKATRRRILREFEKLADEVKPQDKLLIYFSGHGFLDKRKKGYWVPYNGKIGSSADLIPNVMVKDKIEDVDSRHTLLVADSCFSGSFFPSKQQKRVVTLEQGLERLRSRLAIASGRHYQLADDGEPGMHSPFAASIIEYLNENNLYELTFTRFSEEVRRRTNERAPKQSPVFGRLKLKDEDEGGEYIFRLKKNEANLWAETIKEGTVLALSRFLSDFPLGQFSDEARRLLVLWEEEDTYWQDILGQGKISAFHIYLGNYPEGRYLAEARRRIKALERQEQIRAQKRAAPVIGTFSDPRDGQEYATIELDGKLWMAQNLNYDVGEGCWPYKNGANKDKKHGRLYTWEAARKACPPGWRLPTDADWRSLALAYGGLLNMIDTGDPRKAYAALVEGGDSGFAALLGGFRGPDGSCYAYGVNGYYWSGTEKGRQEAWRYTFVGLHKKLCRHYFDKSYGFSCRCIRSTLPESKG